MHDDVDAVGQTFEQLRRGVRRADVQGQAAPAQTRGQGLEVSLGRWHIEQDHLGAIAGQGFGNRRTDAPGRASDQCLAPRQRPAPVLHRCAAGLQAQYLAGDERAFR
ncbi:hypothetical protein D3C77_61930 [compost metagenome]